MRSVFSRSDCTHGTRAFDNQIQTGINIDNYLSNTITETCNEIIDYKLKDFILEIKSENIIKKIQKTNIIFKKIDDSIFTKCFEEHFIISHDQIIEFQEKIYLENKGL